jgi:hypothetical protein
MGERGAPSRALAASSSPVARPMSHHTALTSMLTKRRSRHHPHTGHSPRHCIWTRFETRAVNYRAMVVLTPIVQWLDS